MRTRALFMGLRACNASQDASKRRSGGFLIEAESDVETMEVGDAADSLVPHVSKARSRARVSARESEGSGFRAVSCWATAL